MWCAISSKIYGLEFHLEEKIHKDGSPASLSLKKTTSIDESKDTCRTQKKVIDPKHWD